MNEATQTQQSRPMLCKLYTLANNGKFERERSPIVSPDCQPSVVVPLKAIQYAERIFETENRVMVLNEVLAMRRDVRLDDEMVMSETLANCEENVAFHYTYNFSAGFKRPQKLMLSKGFCRSFAVLSADPMHKSAMEAEASYSMKTQDEDRWKSGGGMAGNIFESKFNAPPQVPNETFQKFKAMMQKKHSLPDAGSTLF